MEYRYVRFSTTQQNTDRAGLAGILDELPEGEVLVVHAVPDSVVTPKAGDAGNRTQHRVRRY